MLLRLNKMSKKIKKRRSSVIRWIWWYRYKVVPHSHACAKVRVLAGHLCAGMCGCFFCIHCMYRTIQIGMHNPYIYLFLFLWISGLSVWSFMVELFYWLIPTGSRASVIRATCTLCNWMKLEYWFLWQQYTDFESREAHVVDSGFFLLLSFSEINVSILMVSLWKLMWLHSLMATASAESFFFLQLAPTFLINTASKRHYRVP